MTAPCTWLISEWEAGDLLAYCGSILGAAATITAIIITIQFTLENQKNERKLGIKPYLQSTYQPLFNRIEAANEADGQTVFIVFPHDKEGHIGSSLTAPYLLSKKEKEPKEAAIVDSLAFKKEHYIMQYSLSNVGAGNAIEISFTLNGIPPIPSFSLVENNIKRFIIILGAELLKDGKYEVSFVYKYKDIASIARYEQHEKITFYSDDDGFLNTKQDIHDLLSVPDEL